MSKTRITLVVFVPSLVVVLILLHLYIAMELKNGLQTNLEFLQKRVNDYSLAMTINARDVTRQVDIIASLLSSDKNDDITKILEKSMQEYSYVDGLAVAIDPDFLKGLQNGRFPSLDLHQRFGKLEVTGIPSALVLTIYRGENNTLRYKQTSSEPYTVADWYIVPKMVSEPQWLNPFVSPTTGHRVCAYGRPFYYKNIFAGIVSSFVPIESLIDPRGVKLQSEGNKDKNRFFVLGRSGNVIYNSDYAQWPKYSLYSMADERGKKEIFTIIDSIIKNDSGRVKTSSLEAQNIHFGNANTWYVYSSPRSQIIWSVVGAFDQEDVLSDLKRSLVVFSLGVLLMIIAICSVVVFLLLRAFRPVEEVIRVAEKIADGDLDQRVDPRFENNHDATGEFVRTFNSMITNLRGNMKKAVAASTFRLVVENQYAMAQELQESFLPRERNIKRPEKGYSIAANLIPAKHVAGDLFSYWNLTDTVEAVLIADVSGKGAPAAMVMLEAITLFRELANKTISPSETATRVNAQFTSAGSGGEHLFITLFFAHYDSETGKLQYVNAGHNPPIVIRNGKELHEFPYAKDFVLGVVPDYVYTSEETTLQPGDTLFLYTDGVTDTFSHDGDQFGSDRLHETLLKAGNASAESVLESVLDTLERFRGTEKEGRLPNRDDTTIIVLKRDAQTNA